MKMKKSFRHVMIFAFLIVQTVIFIHPFNNFANAATNISVAECSKNPDLKGCKDAAQTPAAETITKESAAVGVSFWEYAKTLLALVFVVSLLYGMLKFINKKNLKYQQNQTIQSLGGLTLGAQKSVQLLRVGDALFLVGVGEEVQLLKEITDADQIEKLLSTYGDRQEETSVTPYFIELLEKFKPKTKNDLNNSSNNSMFSEVLDKKLSEIKNQRSNQLEKWKEKEKDDS